MSKQPVNAQCALITGATGYIGSFLTRRLVNDGWNVHIIVRSGAQMNLLEGVRSFLTVHVHDGSMNGMLAVFEKSRPDIVFHCASLFVNQHRSEDIDNLVGSNILFATQLVEAMVVSGVRYLLNTGSSWEYYQSRNYNPVNLYAATKKAYEDILKFYIESKDIRVLTLALFDTYGPGDPRPKLLNQLRKSADEGRILKMSPGEQKVDFVYIDDVINAYMIAASILLGEPDISGNVYAIASGEQITLKQLVDKLSNALGRPIPVDWGGRSYREREVMLPWDSGDPLPGWTAKIPLDVGLKLLVDG